MARILNIGSLNLDYVYAVPHFVAPGETLCAASRQVFAGGNTSAVEWAGVPTGHAIIQVSPQGENAIIILGGANRSISREALDRALDIAEEGDILLLQNEINGLDYIIPQAARRGLRILFNPAPMDESVKNLPLGLIDTLVVNEGEGQALAGDMEALKAAYPKQNILLTQGSRGATLFAGGETVFQPAFRVKVLDTTAAGDCFLGYYAAALSEGLPYGRALLLATAASALAVQKQGAAPSIPCRAEVEAFAQANSR